MTNIMNSINSNLGNQLYYAAFTLNSGQITGMFASPVLLIPAPGANKLIQIRNVIMTLNYGGTPYSGGGATALYYDNAHTQTASTTISAANVNSSSSTVINSLGVLTVISGSNSINKPIYLSNTIGAFTSGNSNVTFEIFYSIVEYDSTNVIGNTNNIGGGNYYTSSVYIPSASVQTLNTTPITIAAAPPAGFAIIPERAIFMLIYNSVAYSSAVLDINYGAGGTAAINSNAALLSGSVNQWNQSVQSYNNALPSNLNNKPLVIQASTSPGGSGNSAVKVYLNYNIVPL
jgi:hypothetical protein